MGSITNFLEEIFEEKNTQKINLEEYTETKIGAIISKLNSNYGSQISIDPSAIDTSVTVSSIENISIEEALDEISKATQLEWIKIGSGYLIVMPDENNQVFLKYAIVERVKLSNIDSKNIAITDILTQYRQFIKVDTTNNQIFITALPGKMMQRIKAAIEAIDVDVLKSVEIRLIAVQYSQKEKQEISLSSLDSFFAGTLSERQIGGLQIGENIFGVTNNEMSSMLRLKIMSKADKVEVTGDQRAVVREGKIVKLSFIRKGDLLLNQLGDSNGNGNNGYGYGYNFNQLEKSSVQAEQGVEVETSRVSSNNDILLSIKGTLEDITETPDVIRSGQAIWTESGRIDTSLSVKNYQVIWIGTLKREINKQTKETTGRLKDNSCMEIAFLLVAHVIGTEPPVLLNIDSKIDEFFRQKEAGKFNHRIQISVGTWIQRSSDFAWVPSSSDINLVPLIRAELRVYKNFSLLGAIGGKNSNETIALGGLQYGDFLKGGLGIMSVNKEAAEPFISGGVSLGTDRWRLDAKTIYPAFKPENSGIMISLGARFNLSSGEKFDDDDTNFAELLAKYERPPQQVK